MTKQTVSLKEIRSQLSELIAKVAYGQQNMVITRFGKPIATLISYEEYERIMNPQKRFSKKEWEEGFGLIDKIRKGTKNTHKRKLKT